MALKYAFPNSLQPSAYPPELQNRSERLILDAAPGHDVTGVFVPVDSGNRMAGSGSMCHRKRFE